VIPFRHRGNLERNATEFRATESGIDQFRQNRIAGFGVGIRIGTAIDIGFAEIQAAEVQAANFWDTPLLDHRHARHFQVAVSSVSKEIILDHVVPTAASREAILDSTFLHAIVLDHSRPAMIAIVMITGSIHGIPAKLQTLWSPTVCF